MIGSGLLIDDLMAIALINDKANRVGVDTISLGSFIGFIIKCYEAGFLSEEEIGIVSKWSDNDTLQYLIDKLIKLEGIGSSLEKVLEAQLK